MKKENIIMDKSFEFALSIISLYKKLQSENEYVISKQLLRSGTSIGANIAEAQAAQSTKDFIHKLSIASKEARETRYWLELLSKSDLTSLEFEGYLESLDHIINIITKIVITSSNNQNKFNI